MRIFNIGVLLVVLVYGGVKGCQSLRTPEEVIRDKLEAAIEGFNDTSLGPVMDLFERNFVESNKGYTRDMIKSGVIAAYFREVDPQTKEFLYHVTLNEVEVVVDVNEVEATAKMSVDLDQSLAGKWQPAWSFTLEGKLIVTEYDGWQFSSGKVETITGSKPR